MTSSGDTGLETIHAKLAAMDKRFDEHAQAAAEGREDVRGIRDRLDKGQDMFGQVSNSLVRIETALTSVVKVQSQHDDYHKQHHERLTKLEAEQNVRAGERGVWAAIAKSPAAAWIAAALAAIWAFVSHSVKAQ